METKATTTTEPQPDEKMDVSGSLRLLDEMYEELRLKAKEGFEIPQDLWINSEHQNAILCVRRLIQKRCVSNDA